MLMEGKKYRYFGELRINRRLLQSRPSGLVVSYDGTRRALPMNQYERIDCNRCGRNLNQKEVHVFTEPDETEWVFGSECARYICDEAKVIKEQLSSIDVQIRGEGIGNTLIYKQHRLNCRLGEIIKRKETEEAEN